jgi:putative ABC transport system permease protein
VDGLTQDLRYAARSLRRAPTFAVVAVIVLTLGIGATSAIFSLVHAVLLRPLPFPQPDRIVTAISTQSVRGLRDGGVAYADYLDWRKEADIFQYAALWRTGSLDLTGSDMPERVRSAAVTGEYFAVLGVTPVAGQLFDAAAERPGERPVVLTEGAWRRLFGGRQDAIGRTVFLSGNPYRLTGVVPDSIWPARTDAFIPLRLDPALDKSLLRRDNFIFRSIARLQPGVPLEQGRARLAALAGAIAEQFPESRKHWSYDVVSLHKYTVGEDFERAILILFAAVALVLLIACANLANLLLARGTERRRELAIRSALGASRARIRRVLFAESLVLSCLGGAGGLALGYWLSHVLVAVAPADTPLVTNLGLNWPVVIFTAAASLATAVFVGLIPAMHGALVTPRAAMQEGQRTGTGRAGRLRDVLVTGEMALAVVLLVISALTMRSVVSLLRVDPGVDVSNVLTARIIVAGGRYRDAARRALFYKGLTERVAALPGVAAVGITSRMPAGGPGSGLGRVFLAEGAPEPPAAADHPAQWTVADPGYFRTLKLPLLQGRTFTDADTSSSTPVIVISQRLAQEMFPGQDPIGKRIRSWRDENRLREIIGVVGDVKYFGLADRPRAAVYVPHAQDSWGTMMIALRTQGVPLNLVNALRGAVSAADPALALGDVGTLEDFSALSVSEHRFTAQLLGAFALLALLLAAVGVYGVMAYAVSLRAQEIGVRVALGAQRRDVAFLIVGRGMTLALAGLLIGGVAAVAAARAMRTLLTDIGPGDPLSFAAAAGTLLIAALIACAVPALRAARMDPVSVLR